MEQGSKAAKASVLAAFFILSITWVSLTVPTEASGYTWRVPVVITGNEDFTSENGVTGGSGTIEDPFIIEGWEFTGGYAGIQVVNTSAHFVIRDIYTHANGVGVLLRNVTNGTVDSIDCETNWFGWDFYGIFVDRCSKVNISDNNVSTNGRGVYVTSSDLCNISRNNLSYNNWGISLEETANCTVYGNVVNSSHEGAVVMTSCKDTEVSCNWICDLETGDGIALLDSERIHVSYNLLEAVRIGFVIDGSEESSIEHNQLVHSEWKGMEVSESRAIAASWNTMSEVFTGIDISSSEDITIIGNTVSPVPDLEWSVGLYLVDSVGIVIEDNDFLTAMAIEMWGTEIAHFSTHDIPHGNTANGADIVYVKNEIGVVIDSIEAGQLIVANCSDVVVSDLGTDCARADFCYVENAAMVLSSIQGARVIYSKEIAFVGNEILAPPYSVGVRCDYSEHLDLQFNVISSSSTAVLMNGCDNVAIGVNMINGPGDGIDLSYCTETSVTGNTIAGTSCGVRLYGSSDGTVRNNSVEDSLTAITAVSALGFEVAYNNITDNANGICLYSSRSITVHHNNICNNTVQALDDQGQGNWWDAGYPEGGNYWYDYYGEDLRSGYTQTLPGPDGIGDTPYSFSGNQDLFPLMTEVGSNARPVADAGEDQVVEVGQEMVFDGTMSWDDVGIVNYSWTFEHDGEEVSLYGPEPRFVFGTAGDYSVTLTVWDEEGLHSTDTVVITVRDGTAGPNGLMLAIIILIIMCAGVAVVALAVFLTRKPQKPA